MTRSVALAAAGVVAGALACWAMIAAGFANYDLAYSLVWGADLAHGRVPDYEVSLAPTPHPLATLEGLVLAPLGGAGAEDVAVVLAFLSLGALGAVTYALASTWFGRAAGLIAAAIVLTRQPVLSFGVRGYADIPYLALVLSALLVEARRPRAGTPVLVLLGLAGLLRPEAWLFSAVYVGWLARRDLHAWLRLGAIAVVAPLIWTVSDLLITGDPLHSLTGTRDTADVLERKTGLDEVPLTVPRRLGEILREPVLLGAALGGLLSLGLLRERVELPAAAGVVALLAFCILAAAGLPILGRYLLLPAVVLAIFCAGALTGWREIEGPWRRRWQAAAVVTALALIAFTPAQVDRIDSLRASMRLQDRITGDLQAIAERPPLDQDECTPVAVPTHRPVPLLALYTDRRPTDFMPASASASVTLAPADDRVERNFLLDPKDPAAGRTRPTAPGNVLARNRSWIVRGAC